jgi:hypothetical protein
MNSSEVRNFQSGLKVASERTIIYRGLLIMAGLVSAREMRQHLEVAKEMLTSELISQVDYDGMKEVLLTRFKGDVAPQQQQQRAST